MQQEPQTHIWKGDIRISGYRNALVIPCVAIPYNDTNGATPTTRDTSSWPKELLCDSFKLKSATQISEEVNQSRVYVRFVPVDPHGKEVDQPKLGSIAAVLMERALVFEVPCMASDNRGVLFLWSVHNTLGRYSLIGGFKPTLPPKIGPMLNMIQGFVVTVERSSEISDYVYGQCRHWFGKEAILLLYK